MRFDNGTLISPHKLPTKESIFDERINGYRSLAYEYSESETDTAELLAKNTQQASDLKLREYQSQAIQAWKNNKHRGLICLPTGSGKTQIAMAIIKHLQKKTIILVPTRILLEQWIVNLKRVISGPIGQIGDGKHQLEFITVMTFESAYRHMHYLGNKFDLLIVDEAHHFGSGLRCEALEMAIAPYRLGLTATPPEEDRALQLLEKLIGPIVFKLDIADLKGTYLANFEYHKILLTFEPFLRKQYDEEALNFKSLLNNFRAVHTQGTWRDLMTFAHQTAQGKEKLASLHKIQKLLAYNKSKKHALAKILLHHKTHKSIIFTADAHSTYQVASDFLIYPITSEIKKKERNKIFDFYQKDQINQIVSCRVVNEGYDIPQSEVAIIVSGSLGEREHVQRVGRVLRPGTNKIAKIYELVMEQTMEVGRSQKRSAHFA